jgi:hypothetical protein
MWADDNYVCTYPPPHYSCPSAVIEGAEEGTYQVVVYHYSCEADVGEYTIKVGLR